MTVRIAAIGDVHIRAWDASARRLDELCRSLDDVDALVVAGDITQGGRLAEAEQAAAVLGRAKVPVVAVLGNHDRRGLRRVAFRRTLERVGVIVLDGEATVVTAATGTRIGFAGVAGCGGGFWPTEGSAPLHDRAFKALAIRIRHEATRLDAALASLDADVRVAVLHFAPTSTTLGDEPPAKYWLLGNCDLGQVIDRHPVDLVIHGHAHLGNPVGWTVGGTPVRNVAYPVSGGLVINELPVQAPARSSYRLMAGGERR